MTPEDKSNLGKLVRDTATDITNFLHDQQVPLNIGMASLSMVLATTAKQFNLTRHEVIDRFVSSVNAVYKEGLAHGTDTGSESKS